MGKRKGKRKKESNWCLLTPDGRPYSRTETYLAEVAVAYRNQYGFDPAEPHTINMLYKHARDSAFEEGLFDIAMCMESLRGGSKAILAGLIGAKQT